MVTTHNSTTLKENGMTEEILFLVILGQEMFCIRSPDTKRSIFMPTMLLHPFFHLLTYTNPNILMDAKQQARALLLLKLFEPFVFYGLRTI